METFRAATRCSVMTTRDVTKLCENYKARQIMLGVESFPQPKENNDFRPCHLSGLDLDKPVDTYDKVIRYFE